MNLPRSVETADVADKYVLVRADLNVPLDGSRVADDTRIRASLPSLELLLERGAAEVRADDHLGSVPLEQQLQGRQRRADARVVGDAACLERHVQVGPDQHAPAGDVGVANRARGLHAVAASTGSVAPIIAIRSTSRQL